MAWLRLELDRYGRGLDDERARLYRALAASGDRVPAVLQPLADAMALPDPGAAAGAIQFTEPADGPADSLRRQRLVQYGDRTLVVTRRRALDLAEGATDLSSNQFVRAAVPALSQATQAIGVALARDPLPRVPGDRSPRPVRLYAISEDGTLVSAPSDEGAEPVRASTRELALLGARPSLPTFAPEEFFFHAEPASPANPHVRYSGFYLDLGGRGLVSTLMRSWTTHEGQHGVVALDLAFDIDWQAVAASVEPPVVGAAVRLGDTAPATWAAFDSALGSEAPAAVHGVLADLSARESRIGSTDDPSPLRHGLVEGTGAVAAFQVSDAVWLLMFYPKTSPAFPVVAASLLVGLLALLLGGFEVNRRRAEDERRKAERALGEKQNLLNTMQIPLVVVDPNSDVVVSSNRAAETIGIRSGQRFGDLVWPDARARAHYERMQAPSPEPRRAYGVPVGVRTETGSLVERYAIVRSVAVTAPIEALSADERHRLGVLFVLDPDADLALLAEEIGDRAQRDERRRLAGLLSHGVDTLARVLEHALGRDATDTDFREFTAWLAEYLERRITVSAWLLDHWDAVPPLPQESVVLRDQVDATLARFTRIFRYVRQDAGLRARLHWDNGTLSAATFDDRVLEAHVDWPAGFAFTCPVRGGVGWFLGEVLTNAVRHGLPGTVPRVTITGDRVRKELRFQVENAVDAAPSLAREESYGGLAMLRALARLFEWEGLGFERQPGLFRASWRVPVGELRRGAD
jgi:PAS domain-containing protein